MPKVIHLIPCDGIGGVETAARSMAAAEHLSCEFTLMLIAGGVISKSSSRVIESPLKSANNPLAHCRAISKVLREKPDVLVCSLWRSMFVGLLIKFLCPRIKIVCFLHLADAVHIIDQVMNALMMRVADAVWADSDATLRARCKNARKQQTQVISFVLDNQSQAQIANTCSPQFVFWGRLNSQKGLDRAINFIFELKKHGVDPRFEIWGPDDGEKKVLLSMVKSKGLEENVVFQGIAKPEQLDGLAINNSFYLQLSRVEGMAMSVVEAMQRGLVPIVTPVGEIANYCRQHVNAVVVNDPRDLQVTINKVIKLLNDEESYRVYQNAARERWFDARLYREDFCLSVEQLVSSLFPPGS